MTSVSAAFDFSLRIQPLIKDGIFDTLLFSDQYRRGVIFQGQNFGLENELATLIRHLGAGSTYYYGEYSSKEIVNIEAVEKTLRIVRDIEWRVAGKGATKIILPFGRNSTTFAKDLLKAIEKTKTGCSVVMRNAEYKEDLSPVGKIIPERQTILDEGVRGVCHYKQDLRYKWDRQVA